MSKKGREGREERDRGDLIRNFVNRCVAFFDTCFARCAVVWNICATCVLR